MTMLSFASIYELEEMQREINAEKAQMSEEEILEDKKWHDEQLETIFFSITIISQLHKKRNSQHFRYNCFLYF